MPALPEEFSEMTKPSFPNLSQGATFKPDHALLDLLDAIERVAGIEPGALRVTNSGDVSAPVQKADVLSMADFRAKLASRKG